MKSLFFNIKFVLLAIALCTISLHIFQLSTNRWIIGSDGLGYYAHLRSLVIDHDLDYENEFRDFNPFNHSVQNFRKQTRTGHIANKYPIGPALLWAPFFIAAHFLTLFLHHLGFNFPVNGYSFFYQLFTGIGTTLYGILGLYCITKISDRYFPEKVIACAIGTIFLATNLIYYFIREPSMSHTLSMFAVSLFLYLSLQDFGKKTTSTFLISGMAAGLMILMRYQNALFMIVPLIELIINCFSGGLSRKKLINSIISGLVFLIAVGLILLPQLIVIKIIFGFDVIASQPPTPMTENFAGTGDYTINSFNFLAPKLKLVLFSPRHGLIYWTPIIFLSLAGMFHFACKNRLKGAVLLFCFALQWYIIAAWHGWSFGNAFGARSFINCTAIFTLGLATVIDRWPIPKWFTGLVLFFLIAANLTFMTQFILQIVSHSEPVTWSTVIANNFELMATFKLKLYQILNNIN